MAVTCSGDEDGAIMMWDLSSGRCVTPLTGHTSCVRDFVTVEWCTSLLSLDLHKVQFCSIPSGQWLRVHGAFLCCEQHTCPIVHGILEIKSWPSTSKALNEQM
ncbi:hypothetical protein C1H46_045659 [Malus baccata]|uniref:Uncharacterized protein n=1 Tax=Malus baccata TaxID=106549 RepID=A0A540K3K2_MALBA|nr:hypothetical protein C1H46_045659 [Malus baccata]